MVVRDSKISASVEKGDICGVNLEIENVGFGNIVKTQKVSVILRKDLEYYETTLNVNMNNIKGGEKNNVNFYFYVPSDIEAGDWQVCLKVGNKVRSEYAIQFANPNMWDEDLLANCIGKVTIENSVAKEGIKIKQAFSITATDGYKGQVSEKVVTIPVTFGFYQEGVSEPITSHQFNLALGTTINFKDASNLSSLNIEIPNGYIVIGAQCNIITGDWNYHDSITIPTETSESAYWINVFVRDNKIPVTFAFHQVGGAQIGEAKQFQLAPGTTVNFKDASSLSSLGIEIPSGYTFEGVQCFEITNNWDNHDSLTIPDPIPTGVNSYYFTVWLTQ